MLYYVVKYKHHNSFIYFITLDFVLSREYKNYGIQLINLSFDYNKHTLSENELNDLLCN